MKRPVLVWNLLDSIYTIIVVYRLRHYGIRTEELYRRANRFPKITGKRWLGWRQEFSNGGLTLPARGLKYGLQGTITGKMV